MGGNSPGSWPPLEATKYYKCTCDSYDGIEPPFGCDLPYRDTVKCCLTGAQIESWLAGGNECVIGMELCLYTMTSAQRLVRAYGPYDTFMECFVA